MSTFRVKRTLKKHNRTQVLGFSDRSMSQFYSPSTIDDFLFQKNVDGSITITSDVQMLLNQKRLDKLTTEALIQRFDQVQQRSDSLRELRSKLSDRELCKLVKSRFIQSPSELLAFSEQMLNEYSLLSEEAKAFIQAQQKNPENIDPTDPTVIDPTITSE